MRSKTTCKWCGTSEDLARRGKYFRNECRTCYNARQRESWSKNRDSCLVRSRENYRKHADKRREETRIRKKENRTYYSMLEWFRKRNVSVKDLDPQDVSNLVDIKAAVDKAKKEVKKQSKKS